MKIIPVIMAGGSGTRLWPLSRAASPKQYCSLIGDRPLFAETLERVSGDVFEQPVIIGSEKHASLIADHSAGRAGPIFLEPFGRNTAPAALIAAFHAAEQDPDALVLLLPADHHIADAEAFAEAVKRGAKAAEEGCIVTLGITPTGPETGFGYIRHGEPVAPGVHRVARFVEKPDLETAKTYIADGSYSWNAGIFLYRAVDLMAEAERFARPMVLAARRAYDNRLVDDAFIRFRQEDFETIPDDSIDYAIMENTDKAAVVTPVEIGWNDIGAWSAVRDFVGAESLSHDHVVAIDCEGSLIKSSGPLVAAVGVQNVVIVATDDAVLVLPADRAQDVKKVIAELKRRDRADLL
ncbi:MAG: mannose-1-phosphate guanylyltransferase/mannose-6-phosphate isomerase [Pseudomonadota bacterium]